MNQTSRSNSDSQATSSYQLRCIACGGASWQANADFRCTICGDLYEVIYPQWNLHASSAENSARDLREMWRKRRLSSLPCDESGVWRFREMLPVVSQYENVVTLREGNTPIYELPRCSRGLPLGRLLAKHQGMNPTGSFKDTGMTVALSVARESGHEWVACASTGNTAASVAAYAARARMKSLVLLPAGKISWGKLSQTLDYGAFTFQLKTDFDGCTRTLNQLVEKLPVYILNSVNPFRIEGQKTAAIEMLEQLDWQVPDHVIVPGGNLANGSALGKAFLELRSHGFISSLPKVSVIQAEGANPLVRSIREKNGQELVPVRAETLATAIRIGNPISWKKTVRVLQETAGYCEQVSEAEIAFAKAEIGAEGIGCEPASAATLAGLKKLVEQKKVAPGAVVVLLLTGNLLKDPEYTIAFHRGELLDMGDSRLSSCQRQPVVIDPDPDAILFHLDRARRSNT